MTGNEYQKAALRTADMNYSEVSMIMNGALGLCGEAGEVATLSRKRPFRGHPLDAEHIAEELGDVAWYLAITASAIGKNLDDIFTANVEKLRKRYPDGFDSERSVHRPEYAGGVCHEDY